MVTGRGGAQLTLDRSMQGWRPSVLRLCPLTAMLLLASCLAGCCQAKVQSVHLQQDTSKLIRLTQPFNFSSQQGRLSIRVGQAGLWATPEWAVHAPKMDKIALFLWRADDDAALTVNTAGQDFCVLDVVPPQAILFTFEDRAMQPVLARNLARHPTNTAGSVDFYFEITSSGLFSVYLASCDHGMAVTLIADIDTVNMAEDSDRAGERRDMTTETVYWVLTVAFMLLCAAWAACMLLQYQHCDKVHVWMGVIGCLKAAALASQAQAYQAERLGNDPGWLTAFSVTFYQHLAVICLVLLFCKQTKPYLMESDQLVLLVVFPVQVVANMAVLVTDTLLGRHRGSTAGHWAWVSWVDLARLVDVACCCVGLWCIRRLQTVHIPRGTVGRIVDKLVLLKEVHMVWTGYIWTSRVVLYMLYAYFQHTTFDWVGHAAEHILVLLLYVWVAANFRPGNEFFFWGLPPLYEHIGRGMSHSAMHEVQQEQQPTIDNVGAHDIELVEVGTGQTSDSIGLDTSTVMLGTQVRDIEHHTGGFTPAVAHAAEDVEAQPDVDVAAEILSALHHVL